MFAQQREPHDIAKISARNLVRNIQWPQLRANTEKSQKSRILKNFQKIAIAQKTFQQR